MKIGYVLPALFAIALFMGCKEKEIAPKEVQTAQEIQKFTPTPDSTISARQMQNWLACTRTLDSLFYFYADSFKTKDTELYSRYMEDYKRAQDKICKLSGLPGGYTEYVWILHRASNPRNQGTLESVKARAL